MAKGKELNMKIPSVGDLFSTQEEREEVGRESVRDIPLEDIYEFPNHPFKVKMDEKMMEMVESVRQYGVLVPAIVRPKEDGTYEMVAGHRRRMASELAERQDMPCLVRELTDDEATIIMVDSNLQREEILPSEKAFAYKMKLDAMKRQAGGLFFARPFWKKMQNFLENSASPNWRKLQRYRSAIFYRPDTSAGIVNCYKV